MSQLKPSRIQGDNGQQLNTTLEQQQCSTIHTYIDITAPELPDTGSALVVVIISLHMISLCIWPVPTDNISLLQTVGPMSVMLAPEIYYLNMVSNLVHNCYCSGRKSCIFCRVDIASSKAVMWSDCKMGRSNESGMLFGATVNAER